LLDNKNCDYLVCLDSDDTWEPNFLKHCSKYFSKNPDVIYNKKFREQLKNNSWKISWHFKVITKKSYITHSSGTMWTHMWSSSFLSKFAKLIPEFSGKIRSDDNIMCLVLNSFVKKIVINRHCDYNYFYYENSLMRTYTLNCFREEKNMLQKIAKIIPMNNKSVLKRYNHILKNC
jgi:cellulose synthase/poly-beta-1,6-N-acetylglucosamine synthase-like glycosyltransferase